MNNTTFKFDDSKLKRAIDASVIQSGKSITEIVMQASIYFLQSIIKMTKPGTGSSYKRLPKKYTTRPIVAKTDALNWYAYQRKSDGALRIWKTEKTLSDKDLKSEGYEKLDKAVQYWSRGEERMSQFPYWKKLTTEKQLKIPHAASAKGAWLGCMKLLDKPSDGDTKFAAVKRRIDMLKTMFTLCNGVYYAKQALATPDAMEDALNKASERIAHTYIPKEWDHIKSAWESGR